MMMEGNDKLALVHAHYYISAMDVELIREQCGKLLYITSTTNMKDRMYSAAKYRVNSNNGNVTVTSENQNIVEMSLLRDNETEPFLEAYPYLNAQEQPLLLSEQQKLIPDYVVRSEYMNDDLKQLLEALGCGGDFKSSNVHVAQLDKQRLLDKVKLKMADSTFRRLSTLAQQNPFAIDKAMLF